jgi:hypothetical protein
MEIRSQLKAPNDFTALGKISLYDVTLGEHFLLPVTEGHV